MKKIMILLTIAFAIPQLGQAQDLADALRYSNFQVQGTARAGGMGNAFGALGGDFTSVSINPAGLGLYRSSEFVFTPMFSQTEIGTTYRDNLMTDNKYHFAFNNLSYVAAMTPRNQSETGLISLNFGIGYNRLKDFNTTMLGGAQNMNGSFLDYLADNATIGNWSDFYEQLAWDADLLVVDDDDVYYHDIEQAGYGQSLRKSISKEGSINEYSLALGMNFNHMLYFGASLGIVDVIYREFSELHEWDANNNIDYFNSMTFNSQLYTSGTGYNGKIGLIFKPFQQLRLGASVHTPTFYNLTDEFDTSMESSISYEDGDEDYYAEPERRSIYEYAVESPLRANLSGALVIGKAGLISVDYEYVDYGSAKLRSGGDGYQFVNENEDITEVFKPVGNIRVGGELLVASNISLRAGYEYYPSPYNEQAFGATQPNADADKITYSGGLGFKSNGFFFDIAYRYSFMEDYDMLYPAPVTDFYAPSEMAAFNNEKHKVMFTLGFKF